MRGTRSSLLIAVLAPGLALCGEPKKAKPAASRPAPRTLTMRGIVFEDLNANGTRDADEPPLAGMPISDGLTIARTPASGEFSFEIHEKTRGSVFVCTPAGWRASGAFYVIADFDNHADKVQPADIGLVRDPARNVERFKFVQLSDTHVTQSEDTVRTMIEDLEVVNGLSDVPAFVVTTGDLTNVGKEEPQLAAYRRAIAASKYPLYNVVGNHDYGGELRDTENYERYLGPPYYSFDIGPYHFISKDIIAAKRSAAYYEREQQWIEEDLRENAQGKRVIVFQHYIPTIPELDWWSERNCVGIFSGHWHGRRERVYKGIFDVNSATLRFGGIDRSPRGFRVVDIDGATIESEWRVSAQHRRVEVIHPQEGAAVAGPELPIRVLAYDTAVRVERASFRVVDADAPEAAAERHDLWSEGSWSWVGRWTPPAGSQPGRKRIEVEVVGADGTVWKKDGSFTLTAASPPRITAGEPWRFFHGDAGHRGYLAEGPRPPLALAWATNIGGTIHISSPVIEDGRVYAAGSFERSLDDCAVTALDLATGRKIWRAPVDSSVKHSLAVWEGNVMAVTVAGTLYCLNPEGYPRWTASLDRGSNDRWDTSFPVTDGKAVYAGRTGGFGAYDWETGRPLWRQPSGADWWPSIYSGPSLGAGGVYQGGPLVRLLDPATGEIRWANKEMAVSTVAVVPAAVEQHDSGERLYVFHNQKTLRCLEGATGKQVWEAQLETSDGGKREVVPLGNETGTPAVGEDIVCVGGTEVGKAGETVAAAMHAFDKGTGLLKWRFPVGPEIAPTVPYKRESATITSSPVIVGSVVYFGASDGYFYALDAKGGSLLWKFWFGMPIASTPAVSGNTVIVATWDGTIHALTE